jgi:hypothetical protein
MIATINPQKGHLPAFSSARKRFSRTMWKKISGLSDHGNARFEPGKRRFSVRMEK